MKKSILVAAVAMAMCVPAYAERQYQPNDPGTKNMYPAFGDTNPLLADMGLDDSDDLSEKEKAIKRSEAYKLANEDDEIDLETGRIKRGTIKKDLAMHDGTALPEYRAPKRKKGEPKPDTSKLPVHLFGDHVEFENATGDFVASGKVQISQGPETLTTNYAFGNMKSGDIYLLEGGTLMEPGSYTSAKWVHYNYDTKSGEMKQVHGRGAKDFFNAPHALIMPDKLLADQGGMSTRCTAQKHTPCMHVEAKTLEFYPKEKMVAHEAKVFVKGKHIYSRKLWINEFNGERNTKITPRVGWDGKTNGFFAKLEYENNLTEKDKIAVELWQFSRAGFKPQYKFNHYEKNWDFRYLNGWIEDDDEWYHKENDFRFRYKPHHFIKGIPLTFSAEYEYGLWSRWDPDNGKTRYSTTGRRGSKSWHREYKYYINHDPIKIFGPDTTLHFTFGRKWVHESLTDENKNTNMYYTYLRQKVDSNKKLWIGYLREKSTSSMFSIGEADMARELRLGFQWSPTKNDTFSIVDRYDVGQHRPVHNTKSGRTTTRQYETTYNWYHRFCCWALQLSYEKEWYKKDSSLKAQFFFYNW